MGFINYMKDFFKRLISFFIGLGLLFFVMELSINSIGQPEELQKYYIGGIVILLISALGLISYGVRRQE